MGISVRQTIEFVTWLEGLKDSKGKARIVARLTAMSHGNFGDSKALGDDVVEMRIHAGPGYRLYYCRIGGRVYLLLIGGDKSRQQADIATAKRLAKEYANQETNLDIE